MWLSRLQILPPHTPEIRGRSFMRAAMFHTCLHLSRSPQHDSTGCATSTRRAFPLRLSHPHLLHPPTLVHMRQLTHAWRACTHLCRRCSATARCMRTAWSLLLASSCIVTALAMVQAWNFCFTASCCRASSCLKRCRSFAFDLRWQGGRNSPCLLLCHTPAAHCHALQQAGAAMVAAARRVARW